LNIVEAIVAIGARLGELGGLSGYVSPVTVIEPGPAHRPTLLEELVATSHRRLADLVVEMGRRSPTIGVDGDVRRQLAHDVRAHLQVVQVVVGAELDEDELGEQQRDHAELASALDDLVNGPTASSAVDALADRLARHVELEERRLTVLRARVGARRMSELGYRYADRIDAHLD
jgi:hypothetical protein